MKSSINILIFLFVSSIANAEIVVRMELQQDTNANNIDIKLFEGAAPTTVNSFLKYVDTPPIIEVPPVPTETYVNSFIHRIASTIPIMDGGRFTYTADAADTTADSGFVCTDCTSISEIFTFIFPEGLQLVTADPTIELENFRSNTRGTIAMQRAIFSTPPISPSNWFINMADNSADLDDAGTFGGPYPVFGEIINDTMSIIDAIENEASTTINNLEDIHFQFFRLPLTNYSLGDAVLLDNLVRINSVKKLFSINSNLLPGKIADIDYRFVLIDTDNDAIITITNLGSKDLTINSIADTDVLEPPFSIVSLGDCNNTTLAPSVSCSFTVSFNSSVADDFSETFNIEFGIDDNSELDERPLSYIVTLNAIAKTVLLQNITTSLAELDFAAVALNNTSQLSINVENTGTADLAITAISIDGVNVTEFELTDTCITSSPILAESTCSIDVAFTPITTGLKPAVITIESNDPDQAVLQIPVIAIGDTDIDGILAAEEDASPNAGDNNFDGIQDSVQGNVATFLTKLDQYISLVVRDSYFITNISKIPDNEATALPADILLKHGIFEYVINTPPGTAVELGIVLPAGTSPIAYYLHGTTEFGDTDVITTPHWFKYLAIELINNATVLTPAGESLVRNYIKLVVQDGGPGDADQEVNGKIVIGPGAPAYSTNEGSDSSGSLNSLFLSLFISILLAYKLYRSSVYFSSKSIANAAG